MSASPFFHAEHEAFRDTVRRFVREEIAPHAADWDEAGSFPRALYGKAAAAGLLGLGYAEEFGGCAWEVQQHAPAAARLAMLKNCATQAMQFCADSAVQILGGAGFMRGSRAERIYREVKVMMIGGGAEEIMKDLAARQLGY